MSTSGDPTDIVNVTITAETTGITRAGFSTAMLLGYHTKYVDMTRTYTKLSDLLSDGFAVSDPIYKMAASLIAQNPRVTNFKVGRRLLPFTQKTNFIPTDITVGRIYKIDGVRNDNSVFSFSYTVAPSDTVALIIAGLNTAFTAVSPAVGATFLNNTTNFDITNSTVGKLMDFSSDSPLTVSATNVDPGISADLAAVAAYDNDWYGFAIDSNSKLEITAAAVFAEANKKMFAANSTDSAIGTNASTDIASVLNLAGYKYTALFVGKNLLSYFGAAVLGLDFPKDPGKSAINLKTPASVTVPNLTSTARGYIIAKKANHLTSYLGRNVVRKGTMASGHFWDVTRFVDHLSAQIQENLFIWLVNADKVPYTDASVAEAKNIVMGCIKREMPIAIAPTPAPTVTAPLVIDISLVDKANRLLPDLEFTATYAGALGDIAVSGRIVL